MIKLVSAVLALAETVKIIKSFVETLHKMYVDKEIQKGKQRLATLTQKRAALMKAVRKADSNEERRALSQILGSIDD